MNLFPLFTLIFQAPPTGVGHTSQFSTFTIISVAFIAAVFLVWFFIHRSKEKERLLLIEKGADFSQLPERGTFNFNFPWLKIGIVLTSATIGLGIGAVLFEMGLRLEGAPFILMFLFGGIGMIIAHYLDKPNDNL